MVSTNNGSYWFNSSLTSRTAYTFVASGNNIFCGTEQYGVYLSSNQGVNWMAANFNSQSVPSLAMHGSVIYAGTFGQGVFRSAQISAGWVQTSLNNKDVISLAVLRPLHICRDNQQRSFRYFKRWSELGADFFEQ